MPESYMEMNLFNYINTSTFQYKWYKVKWYVCVTFHPLLSFLDGIYFHTMKNELNIALLFIISR